MTSAEYRATLAPQKPTSATKPPKRVDTGAASQEASSGAEWAPTNKPTQHYVGPYQLAVANGTHYPGRVRLVIVGPESEELTAALVAALRAFATNQQS